jgi:hypothetical protein
MMDGMMVMVVVMMVAVMGMMDGMMVMVMVVTMAVV